MDSEESKQNRDRTKYSCHTIIHLHRVCDFQNDSCLVSLYPKVRSMPEPGTVLVVAAIQKNKNTKAVNIKAFESTKDKKLLARNVSSRTDGLF